MLKDEISCLIYHWRPHVQALPDLILNHHFDPAAIAMWSLLEDYVREFFAEHQAGIDAHWAEIEGMSADLVSHSILKPELGTLAIQGCADLQQLCVYVIYLSTFFHSWINNKQYEDGGDVSYATIGLWNSHDPAYNPQLVAQREARQVMLLWTLSHVRYNSIMDVGPAVLKDLIWQRRQQIEPGIPLANLMMSTNI